MKTKNESFHTKKETHVSCELLVIGYAQLIDIVISTPKHNITANEYRRGVDVPGSLVPPQDFP